MAWLRASRPVRKSQGDFGNEAWGWRRAPTPGHFAEQGPTRNGLRIGGGGRNPRWGWKSHRSKPKVDRAGQPWAALPESCRDSRVASALCGCGAVIHCSSVSRRFIRSLIATTRATQSARSQGKTELRPPEKKFGSRHQNGIDCRPCVDTVERRMKSRPESNSAFTFKELLIVVAVVAVVAILAGVLSYAVRSARTRSENVRCKANLQEVILAFQVWANEADRNTVPSRVPTPVGLYRSAKGTSLWMHYAWISNELKVPLILACPADRTVGLKPAGSWTEFLGEDHRNQAVSYALGMDIGIRPEPDARRPATRITEDGSLMRDAVMIDRHFKASDVPADCSALAPGAVNVVGFRSGDSTVDWSNGSHPKGGNVARADGSVATVDGKGLLEAISLSDDKGSAHFMKP